MNRKGICLSMVLIVAALFLPTVALVETDGDTYEFDVSPGQTIYFDLKSGAGVSIQGWDKSKAKVTYVQRGEGHSHDVEILQQRDGLLITSDMEIQEGTSRDLDFEVRVPRKYNVHFESMGGGLRIVDLDGKFTGSTMGGGLTLREVEGTVKLTTMGGAIEVTSADLDGRMSTMGGTVYLKDVVGDLEAESMGGNVRYENVRGRNGELRAPGGALNGMDMKTVTITTMGGDITVDDAPAGAWVKTMGGDIEVDNASGFVKASTMGGGVNINVVDGWVDASTMAGDVNVRIAGGLGEGEKGVNLSSCCGDVSLALPADLPVDLDLTISYTKNSSQDFEIISDFDLEIEWSKAWDYSNGTPRKRIHGTARMGSGKYPIVIETVNGNIRLKKVD
jgi:DUF4097 and DUF4098 domain-containing protein YvlB